MTTQTGPVIPGTTTTEVGQVLAGTAGVAPADAAAPNPSTTAEKEARAFRRIPMSVPLPTLAVPSIEGYSLYWFLEHNVPRARQGGYEFVRMDEVPIHQQGVANSLDDHGSTDLGDRISIITEAGRDQPVRQYLMKIRLEWYNEDQRALEKINSQRLAAIFRGEVIPGADRSSEKDRRQMYLRDEQTGMRKNVEEQPLMGRPPRRQA